MSGLRGREPRTDWLGERETRFREELTDLLMVYEESERENGQLREMVRETYLAICREYPQGGFPDMGLLEKGMRQMGIEVSE